MNIEELKALHKSVKPTAEDSLDERYLKWLMIECQLEALEELYNEINTELKSLN